VKVNTGKYGSLNDVFMALQNVAAGGSSTELLQIRQSENTILCGREGITERIINGEFPPSPSS